MNAYKTYYSLSVYNKTRLIVPSAEFTLDDGDFAPYEDVVSMDWNNINEVLERSISLPFGRRVSVSSARKGKELFIFDNYNQSIVFKEWKDPYMTAQLRVKKVKYEPTLEELKGYKDVELATAYMKEYFDEAE